MTPAVAIVGLGAWYPGARNPRELWENVLSRRRQFRRFPDQRLPMSEYHDPAPRAPDKTYGTRGAFIDGFEFDWAHRRIPKKTVEVTDIAHWLALEVALQALDDSGYEKQTLPGERTGVVVGNTMTGEQARTSIMRLRWPYVARSLRAAAGARGLSDAAVAELEGTMEQYYKSVFPGVTEDTLAGSLSNTIAGRICNFLDLKGGGYTVDGACASGMIAVATAAAALHHGELDFALAGGVDISLDAMELVGFAKVGALARDDMNVYDRRGSGFIPGEGCGFVALKRLEDARRDGDYVYAVIRGWGISSDGAGGLTAPSAASQAIMLRRAYERAGYSPHELAFVEGHGTATVAGDKAELEGIQQAMDAFGEAPLRSCGMTSFKSLVGHTKAASGLGGLIKATIAANRRVVPPTAGCTDPNKVFGRPARGLYPVLQGQVRDPGDKLRVGASAMGFGGINCHVALESGDPPAAALDPAGEERALMASHQETELFVLGAASVPELSEAVAALGVRARGMSLAELTDLAAALAAGLDVVSPLRAAIVARSPDELLERIEALEALLRDEPPAAGRAALSAGSGIAAGNRARCDRVTFLFPGQGSQQLGMARELVERFEWARQLVERADGWLRDSGSEPVGGLVFRPLDRAADRAQREHWAAALARTEVAQPAICLASLLWLRYLERLGIGPAAVAGHSLGELTAFCAAGAFDERELIELAALRGRAMAAPDEAAGTMASLACAPQAAAAMIADAAGYVVVANRNSPAQTVVSGERAAVDEVMRLAEAQEVRAVELPVSNAFHSQLVAGAADELRAHAAVPAELAELPVAIHSSMTGTRVAAGLDLRRHVADQVISPVDFVALIEGVNACSDLLLEVGPGRVLTGLARAIGDESAPPCLPIASKPGADGDLNVALAELFVRGADIDWEELYAGRLVRPFTAACERLFVENQLERPFDVSEPVTPTSAALGDGAAGSRAPALAAAAGLTNAQMDAYLERRGRFLAGVVRADLGTDAPAAVHAQADADAQAAPAADSEARQAPGTADDPPGGASVEERLIALAAEQTGFAPETLSLDMRLLDDLNLDSIKAAELVTAAARHLGAGQGLDPGGFANATLAEVATALGAHEAPPRAGGRPAASADELAGRSSAVRTFVVEHVARALPATDPEDLAGVSAVVLADPSDGDLTEDFAALWRERGAAVQVASFSQAATALSGSVDHVVAVLPRSGDPDATAASAIERAVGRLHGISAMPAAREGAPPTTLVFLQFGGGFDDSTAPCGSIEQCCAAGFAASVHHERPDLKLRVVDASPTIEATVLAQRVLDEIATPQPYVLAGYDAGLTRRVPQPRVQDAVEQPPRDIAWSRDDVVLVTGGGKGITAECALALAGSTKARMALVGSSQGPGGDQQRGGGEIGRTLERFAEQGLAARYYRCDVTDPAAVDALVDRVRGELGPITGVIHGAGSNVPRTVDQVTVDEALAEVAPKVLGMLNLCAALEDAPPRLICGLSSIIGFTGMPGNAWYAFANEALELSLRRFRARHPQTAVVSPAFSVWGEVGMGARLGAEQHLARMGVAPIPVDEGVGRFLELVQSEPRSDRVLVAARLRGLDTWAPELPQPPDASRYLEQVVHAQPGVEVVARATLTLERDDYLEDHVYKGIHLFPTTFGLEAMAQAAAYALGARSFDAVRFEDVRLERPVTVDAVTGARIEVRAEVIERRTPHDPVRVRTAIGAETSGFEADHFSATLVIDPISEPSKLAVELPHEPLAIDPRTDLYGGLLFQGPRFQRLETIHRLDSSGCLFRAREIEQPLLLGDPFFRDALLQAPQLVAPQTLGLPVAIDALELFARPRGGGSRLGVVEYEGEHDGHQQASVMALEEDGTVRERLSGYRTRILERREDQPTAEQLADPAERDGRLLDRRLAELAASFGVTAPTASLAHLAGLHALGKVERHALELPLIERTLRNLLGGRSDSNGAKTPERMVEWLDSGKPVVSGAGGELDVSLSHDDEVCMCVAGPRPQGCDIAPLSQRGHEQWVALLGSANERLLEELAEEAAPDRAATRIWAAVEALRKAAGGERPIELALERRTEDAALLRGGGPEAMLQVLTFPLRLTRGPERLVAVVVPRPRGEEAVDSASEGRPDRVFVARDGSGPRVLFVHGSVVGPSTWEAQRPLAKRWTTMVLERRGFGRSPPAERDDFEADARDIAQALGDGAHLVAHSYGAIGALLAATARPDAVHSLTLVEPVAYSVAADLGVVQHAVIELLEYGASGPRQPRAFLDGFQRLLGLDMQLPASLPPAMEAATRLLMSSNPPFAARIGLDELARARIPTLAISGGHSEAFEAICDRLAERLGAERAVIPGAKHAVPAVGRPFNDALERFLSMSASS